MGKHFAHFYYRKMSLQAIRKTLASHWEILILFLNNFVASASVLTIDNRPCQPFSYHFCSFSFFTGLTTWSCVSPNNTMMIMAGSPLLYLLFYAVMDKNHSSKPEDSKELDTDSQTTLTWKEKISTAGKILPLVLALFVCYVSEYVIIQAVITTMAFPNAPFPPRVHYRYYIFIFLSGEFIARSYLAVIASLKPSLVNVFAIRRIWILSLILFGQLIFFTLAAWYRFLHDVWIVFILIFCRWTGGGRGFHERFCGGFRDRC